MSSDSIQTTVLVILMAADPRPLSPKEILKDTVGGVTEQQIVNGLNDLFAKGWVQPFNAHPRNADCPRAVLTAAGKSHLQLLVMQSYAAAIRDMGAAS